MWKKTENNYAYESGDIRIVLHYSEVDGMWLYLCRAISIDSFETLGKFSDVKDAQKKAIEKVREKLNYLIACLPSAMLNTWR